VKRCVGVLLVLALVVLPAACGSKTVVLGSPNLGDGKALKIHPGKLTIAFSRFLDTNVVLEFEFAARMNATPMEGYQAMLVRSEFGAAYIAVKNGLYQNEIASLNKGDTVRVYGRVSASRLPTDPTPKTTIVVDE